ncbi:hypothetical protein CLV40_101184 [Actinokineospora auranticolor]|uniref:Enoyl-CoA hydratase/isomerase-like protein n=1 Tax=Actinokineospora auranticolor TaxID=155976 RepID=A0A2S6H0L3_9PSEU|nr:hypothetical protein CLV40_101184 [Actinokineospora auranticolor]
MTEVRVDRVGGVAVLTVDAPSLNLYTAELHEDFARALDAVEADPPRAVLVRAEGKVVSGGVDVALFAARGRSRRRGRCSTP